MASERGVPTCELVRDCGEDVPELLSFEVIPGAEEARAEVDGSTLCNRFGECLGDGRFSCSSQPVEPEDVSILLIFGPAHYPIKDGLSSPAKTGIVVTSLVSCVVYRVQLFKQLEFYDFLVIVSVFNHQSADPKPPHNDVLGAFINLLGCFVNPLRCFVDPVCSLFDPICGLPDPVCGAVNPVRSLLDPICRFTDPLYVEVSALGVLVNALLQRCLSKALDGSKDRDSVLYLVISDGVSQVLNEAIQSVRVVSVLEELQNPVLFG